jgi:hypothetical protein
MRLSKLIEILEDAKEEHGDVEVRIQYIDESGFSRKDDNINNYYDEEDGTYTL